MKRLLKPIVTIGTILFLCVSEVILFFNVGWFTDAGSESDGAALIGTIGLYCVILISIVILFVTLLLLRVIWESKPLVTLFSIVKWLLIGFVSIPVGAIVYEILYNPISRLDPSWFNTSVSAPLLDIVFMGIGPLICWVIYPLVKLIRRRGTADAY